MAAPLHPVEVPADPPRMIAVATRAGTTAPQSGGSAGDGQVFAQLTPAATWVIPHDFGRRPVVAVYDADGAEILTDVAADSSAVIVTFAQRTAGSAVLI